MHRVDVRTHTGGTSRAGEEWGVEADWEMKEPKEPKPVPGQNSIASSNE